MISLVPMLKRCTRLPCCSVVAQIEAAVKKQKDKEKKMYGKMFG